MSTNYNTSIEYVIGYDSQCIKNFLFITYLGKEQSLGCHLQCWYKESCLPFFKQVTCSDRNSHSFSLYKGWLTSSKTHSPTKISQFSGGNSISSLSSPSIFAIVDMLFLLLSITVAFVAGLWYWISWGLGLDNGK